MGNRAISAGSSRLYLDYIYTPYEPGNEQLCIISSSYLPNRSLEKRHYGRIRAPRRARSSKDKISLCLSSHLCNIVLVNAHVLERHHDICCHDSRISFLHFNSRKAFSRILALCSYMGFVTYSIFYYRFPSQALNLFA